MFIIYVLITFRNDIQNVHLLILVQTNRDLILSDKSRPLFTDSFSGRLAVQLSSPSHFCFFFVKHFSGV
jgi:hypothetical protein